MTENKEDKEQRANIMKSVALGEAAKNQPDEQINTSGLQTVKEKYYIKQLKKHEKMRNVIISDRQRQKREGEREGER